MSDNNFIENVAVSKSYAYGAPKNQEKIQNSSSWFWHKGKYLADYERYGRGYYRHAANYHSKRDGCSKTWWNFLSNGPGDPKVLTSAVEEVKQMMKLEIPIFGICLGHQIIGQVFGGKIVRAKNLMHGKTSKIKHQRIGLFKNIQNNFWSHEIS